MGDRGWCRLTGSNILENGKNTIAWIWNRKNTLIKIKPVFSTYIYMTGYAT